MASPDGNAPAPDPTTITYPRFEHGEELLVVVGSDYVEFRSEPSGEYVRADAVERVTEWA